MRRKNFILLTTFCFLVLTFQFNYFFSGTKYFTPGNNSFKEITKLNSIETGSFKLNERATYGLSTWAKLGDWITFNFETIPSLVIEVTFVDEAEWNTKPKDGIFTDGTLWGEDDKGFGVFFPSHEGKWFIAFRNPTYLFTTVYYTIETSPHIIIRNPSSSTTAYTDSTLEITWKTNFVTWV